MKKTKKKPEQICGVLVYEGLQLPMIMVQGWFSDQYDCFRLFLKALTDEEQEQLFRDEKHLESVKAKCKTLWDDGTFKKSASKTRGVHKLQDQLRYG